MSQFNRLVVAGSDIIRVCSVNVGLIYFLVLPFSVRSLQKAEV